MTGVLDPERTVVRPDPGVADDPVTGDVRPPSAVSTLLSRVLLAVAVTAVWVLAYVHVLSGFAAAHDQQGLYARIRTELAKGTAPVGGTIAAGAPVAVLVVPSLSTGRLVVVEGTTAEQLQRGPGHLRTSVLPGQRGRSTVFGRSTSFGGPFAGIASLRSGARIDVTTGQGRFRFRVTGVRHRGDRVVTSTRRARLTLVTSEGSAPLTASSLVYVDAVLDGSPAASSTPPATLTAAERPLASGASFSSVLELVLALQLVLGALLLSTWAWVRWSRAGAWVVGLPLVLAAMWFCSGIASRLLPNLL